MIEIVYREDDKKGEEISVKLPKNIRQIGDTAGKMKIYFEEKVHKLIVEAKGYGVLMGKVKHVSGCSYIFISGLVIANNKNSDMIEFNDKIWADITRDIKEYYENLEVVGWYVADYKKSLSDEKITKIHREHFFGNDRICLIENLSEKENEIYTYYGKELERIGGYYLFYEKNPNTDRYIAYVKTVFDLVKVEDKNDNIVEVKDNIVVEKQKNNSSKPETGILKGAIPSYVVIAFLLALIVVLNNYNQISSIKHSLTDIAGNLVNTSESEQVNANATGAKESEKTKKETTTVEETTKKKTTQKKTTQKKTEKKTEKTTEKETETTSKKTTKKTVKANAKPVETRRYYTIKPGETLSDVSRKEYNSIKMVDEIMKANDIEDANLVFEGQKIILP